MANVNFSTVTELPGAKVSREQVQRGVNRYSFAAELCRDKDVLELACGTGIGLGILRASARSLIAGDIDQGILDRARLTYGNSVDLRHVDAENLPVEDNSFDVIILFEAIYYLPRPERFVQEARRVLRQHGAVIVCNPNKDLPDFNPSPFSHRYFNASEFCELFDPSGFEVACYGDSLCDCDSLAGRALSFVKRWTVRLDLIPKTMRGKAFLKRLVFGKLVPLPPNLLDTNIEPYPLNPIATDVRDLRHKIIFCVAFLRD